MRRLARIAPAVGLVVGAALLAVAVSRADAQALDVSVDVLIHNDELSIGLSAMTEPIGTVELTIAGLPELDDECAVAEGIGACNTVEGVMTFVALHTTGWAEAVVLTTVDLENPVEPADVVVELVRVTDLVGDDLVGALGDGTWMIEGREPDRGSGRTVALAIGGVLIAVIGAALWWRRSRSVVDSAH